MTQFSLPVIFYTKFFGGLCQTIIFNFYSGHRRNFLKKDDQVIFETKHTLGDKRVSFSAIRFEE